MAHPGAGARIRERFERQLQASGIPQVWPPPPPPPSPRLRPSFLCCSPALSVFFPWRPLGRRALTGTRATCASASSASHQSHVQRCADPPCRPVVASRQEGWEAEWRRELGTFASSASYLSDVHAYTLANVLRRPLVIFGDEQVRRMGARQRAQHALHGVEQACPAACARPPSCLCTLADKCAAPSRWSLFGQRWDRTARSCGGATAPCRGNLDRLLAWHCRRMTERFLILVCLLDPACAGCGGGPGRSVPALPLALAAHAVLAPAAGTGVLGVGLQRPCCLN